MKNKKWYMALMLVCALSLAACGKKTPAAESGKKETEQAEVKFKDRENLDVGFFKVFYPEGWNYDEENMTNEEDYSSVTFFDGETRDGSENEVYIKAYTDDVNYFRSNLDKYIDLKDFAEGKLEKQTIGNAEYTFIPETSEGSGFYTYRHEPASIIYEIQCDGDREADSVKALLEGIELVLKDGDNKDAPWPWEGEPFQPELTEKMVGTYTIVPEFVPFEESYWTFDIMEHRFFKLGGQVYHLLADKLDTYEYTDGGMKLISTVTLDDEFEYISSDNKDMLFLSPGIGEVVGVKDGQQVMVSTVKGDLTMDPTGKWGITSWVGSDTMKVTNQDGTLTEEPWILTNMNQDDSRQGPFEMVTEIEITDSHIMVAGTMADDKSTQIIEIYDYDGNHILELGSTEGLQDDSLGSVTGMAETDNGFVAIDGNMRRIFFWNKEGTFLGFIRTDEIFGADYPWLEDMQLLEDGSLLILMTQERADSSSDELMFFKLTGF